MASRQSQGYGCFGFEGSIQLVHRLAYQHFYGPIPDDMQVLHTCDNRPCVAPFHLFLGTLQDNMRDRQEKGRNVLFSGEKNGRAKLTEGQVEEIRERRAAGISAALLAGAYGVHQATIYDIARGRSWANGVAAHA